MALTAFDLMVPTFQKMLPNLEAILDKAEADAANRKIEPETFLQGRLAPDMFTFTRQVQVTTDQVKGGLARLAGVEVPAWPDDEKSFADLKARVRKALDYTKNFRPEQFEGAETRDVELKFPNATFTFKGRAYLLDFVLPNFYFHFTAAYAILRHNGVQLGKRDFLGG